jgi:hypothetical protein
MYTAAPLGIRPVAICRYGLAPVLTIPGSVRLGAHVSDLLIWGDPSNTSSSGASSSEDQNCVIELSQRQNGDGTVRYINNVPYDPQYLFCSLRRTLPSPWQRPSA